MTKSMANASSLARSSLAVLLGLLTVMILSIGTDQVLHSLEIYPPWGQPMHDTVLNLLALAYRSVYVVLGGYVAAKLAPHAPVRHAVVLGTIGLALSVAGGLAMRDFGPIWLPVALAIVAVPCSWFGGLIYSRLAAPLSNP
jgi:hypothetical protein